MGIQVQPNCCRGNVLWWDHGQLGNVMSFVHARYGGRNWWGNFYRQFGAEVHEAFSQNPWTGNIHDYSLIIWSTPVQFPIGLLSGKQGWWPVVISGEWRGRIHVIGSLENGVTYPDGPGQTRYFIRNFLTPFMGGLNLAPPPGYPPDIEDYHSSTPPERNEGVPTADPLVDGMSMVFYGATAAVTGYSSVLAYGDPSGGDGVPASDEPPAHDGVVILARRQVGNVDWVLNGTIGHIPRNIAQNNQYGVVGDENDTFWERLYTLPVGPNP